MSADDSAAAIKATTMMDIIKEKTKRYITTIASAAEFLALQLLPTTYQPDCIIAGLPVYHLQHEGHAASDEVLKYRSMGSIFLAHQKGGKRTFKCTLKIEGPARLYVLSFLQFLQRNGMEANINFNDFTSVAGVDIKESTEPFTSPTANDKIKYMEGHEIELEFFEWHKTFPIITDTKIYTNMYLETLRYIESSKLGAEGMEIDLAFREFTPPMHVMWYPGDDKNKGYYTTWLSNEERDAMRRLDLVINGLWALRTYTEEIFNPAIQEKQRGRYHIEGAVLAIGAALGKVTIWK